MDLTSEHNRPDSNLVHGCASPNTFIRRASSMYSRCVKSPSIFGRIVSQSRIFVALGAPPHARVRRVLVVRQRQRSFVRRHRDGLQHVERLRLLGWLGMHPRVPVGWLQLRVQRRSRLHVHVQRRQLQGHEHGQRQHDAPMQRHWLRDDVLGRRRLHARGLHRELQASLLGLGRVHDVRMLGVRMHASVHGRRRVHRRRRRRRQQRQVMPGPSSEVRQLHERDARDELRDDRVSRSGERLRDAAHAGDLRVQMRRA